mmetsp:Transcript_1226/g.3103  ORF Transcript_1226/g.3103 Transcript_1226/m.3103 type:complete len:877 (+) Transcript_1226:207-2837(+)
MRIRGLSSLTALIIVCSIDLNEAFVNTISTSSIRSATTRVAYSNLRNDHGNGSPGRGRKSYSRQRRKFDRKPRNDSATKYYDESLIERRQWLDRATHDMLEKEAGSLVKGKWHELVSMMKGWQNFAKMYPEAPVRIEQIIKRLNDERFAGNENARTDISMYNSLLDSWCCVALFASNYKKNPQYNNNESSGSSMAPVAAAQRAREILVRLQESYEDAVLNAGTTENIKNVQPNEESFGLVFDVVLKVEGLAPARRFLAWMEYLSKTGRNSEAKPVRKYYMRLLNAYANSRNSNAGVLAEGILRHMVSIGEMPDTVCYNIAIKAWTLAKRGRKTAEHADQILEEMQAPRDVVTYSSVISAWSASGMKSHAVVRAEELLKEIEDEPDVEPNTVVLNSIMSAWVKSKNRAAVNRTTELLEYMEYSRNAPADLVTYNTHLHALSMQSERNPEYAKRANDLLVSLEERYERGEIRFRPNKFSYNVVIEAWCRSRAPGAAWEAVKVLRSFIRNDSKYEPDIFSFNQVFAALSRSTKTGTSLLAENLLEYMEIAYRNGIFKNAKADVVSYTSVIITLVRSGEPDAAERAENLLRRMKEQYESGKTYMKPTRLVYNHVIDAWSKSGGGLMASRKADALLKEMEEMHAMGDSTLAPNIATYNRVMTSWAKSGTRVAENMTVKYLDRMTMRNGKQGEIEIRPNDRTFHLVINAITNSHSETKAQKSLRILRRMDKLYQSGYKGAKPNTLTYNNVLNAAASSEVSMDWKTKRKALDTAIFTLKELQSSEYGQPTELSYSTLMKACSNLLSTEDDPSLREIIENTFHQCKEDGQVGEMFLSRLREAAPEDLYRDLLSDVVASNKDEVTLDDLPQSWRCNVVTRSCQTL